MPTQGHIHLETIDNRPWTTDGAPDNTYWVIYQSMGQKPLAWVEKEIALDGTVHVWQLVDDSGDIIQRDDFSSVLLVPEADFPTLKAEVGKKVDFVPPIHPNGGEDHSDYVVEMLLSKMKVEEVDPMLTYYRVTVELEALE